MHALRYGKRGWRDYLLGIMKDIAPILQTFIPYREITHISSAHIHSFTSENHPLLQLAETGFFLRGNGAASEKKRARKENTSRPYLTPPYKKALLYIYQFSRASILSLIATHKV